MNWKSEARHRCRWVQTTTVGHGLAVLVAHILLVAFSSPAAPVLATEEAPTVDLMLEKIAVEPARPGLDTLCKLTVTIRNHRAKTASQLGLKVSINGVALSVYGSQLFLSPIAPEATLDLPLYNFWTTESGRPAPANGRLEIEIVLTEAQWIEITTDDEGVEVWTPLGAVERLPPPLRLTVPLN